MLSCGLAVAPLLAMAMLRCSPTPLLTASRLAANLLLLRPLRGSTRKRGADTPATTADGGAAMLHGLLPSVVAPPWQQLARPPHRGAQSWPQLAGGRTRGPVHAAPWTARARTGAGLWGRRRCRAQTRASAWPRQRTPPAGEQRRRACGVQAGRAAAMHELHPLPRVPCSTQHPGHMRTLSVAQQQRLLPTMLSKLNPGVSPWRSSVGQAAAA